MTAMSERPELDTSKVAYQLPQPAGMMPDIFLGGALDLDGDERDWVLQARLRAVRACTESGVLIPRVLGVRAVELIMTAPLSQDLRERIVRAVEGGSSIRQAARRFAVSASAAIKLMQRVRRTGSTAPAKIGGA